MAKKSKHISPETKDRDNFGEDIRKFLIEHELGRRIARMLRGHLNSWKKGIDSRELVVTKKVRNDRLFCYFPSSHSTRRHSLSRIFFSLGRKIISLDPAIFVIRPLSIK